MASHARIYLLRHAHSGWAMPGERDFDRGLDRRGWRESDGMGAVMAVNGFVPALVLCSDAVRCVETVRAVESRLDQPLAIRYCTDLYVGGRDDYLDLIVSADGCESVLVVGHNPMMEDTALALVRHADAMPAGGFPTAGLAVIDLPGRLDRARSGCAVMSEFLSPKDC